MYQSKLGKYNKNYFENDNEDAKRKKEKLTQMSGGIVSISYAVLILLKLWTSNGTQSSSSSLFSFWNDMQVMSTPKKNRILYYTFFSMGASLFTHVLIDLFQHAHNNTKPSIGVISDGNFNNNNNNVTPVESNKEKKSEQLIINGPLGTKLEYLGNGSFIVNSNTEFKNKNFVGILCGGSGIVTIFPLIEKWLQNPTDKTKIVLISINYELKDVLMQTELEKLALLHPNRFRVHFCLQNAPSNWTYSTGFINQTVIMKFFPPVSKQSLVLCCCPTNLSDSINNKEILMKLPPPSDGKIASVHSSSSSIQNAAFLKFQLAFKSVFENLLKGIIGNEADGGDFVVL